MKVVQKWSKPAALTPTSIGENSGFVKGAGANFLPGAVISPEMPTG